jgi:phosphoglycerate dehydrogenase-like enzyme
VKALFMSKPGNASPWLEEFDAALGDAAEVDVWSPEQPFAGQVKGARAVVDAGAALEPAMIQQASKAGVTLWQMMSAGFDHLDLELFRAEGIAVANTPGQFSAPALAEHALMLMLCALKAFPVSQRDLARGRFYRSFGNELGGLTLGLVGLGASGRELARIARSLNMRVIGLDPLPPDPGEAVRVRVEVLGGPEALPALLGASDVVSIHVPLSPATRGMIGRSQLESMKHSACLINVSRGQVVDQQALLEALRSGRLACAGLDVFAVEPLPPDDPLLALDNVVLTPHVAGSTYQTARRRGAAAADNLRRLARGEDPLYVVT